MVTTEASSLLFWSFIPDQITLRVRACEMLIYMPDLFFKSRIRQTKTATRLIPRMSSADTSTQSRTIFLAIFMQSHSVHAIPVLTCAFIVYVVHMIWKQAKFNYILLFVNHLYYFGHAKDHNLYNLHVFIEHLCDLYRWCVGYSACIFDIGKWFVYISYNNEPLFILTHGTNQL